jgi:ribosomal protein S7
MLSPSSIIGGRNRNGDQSFALTITKTAVSSIRSHGKTSRIEVWETFLTNAEEPQFV